MISKHQNWPISWGDICRIVPRAIHNSRPLRDDRYRTLWKVVPPLYLFSRSHCLKSITYRKFDPILARPRENDIQITFKQLAGVDEVLFGIGDGAPDPLKRFIANGDDAPLFGKDRKSVV